jgi:aminoglycoside phosphotransferase (APT) family kinase protein
LGILVANELGFAEHTTLPIPKVIACGTLDAPFQDKHYIIVEAVSGVAPDIVWPDLTSAAQEVFVKDMAKLLAQQATVPLPEAGSFLRSHLEKHTLVSDGTRAEHRWKDEEKAQVLLERLRAVFPVGYEAMMSEGSFILSQSDYNPGNIFINPTTGAMTGLIDFELARLMPRLFDFAGPEWLVDAVEDLPDMPKVPAQSWTWTQRRLGIRTLSHHLGEVFRSELESLEPGIIAKLKETRPFREWCRAGWLRGREDIAQPWIEEMNMWLDVREQGGLQHV